MRTIKFKAKRIDNGEWLEGYYRGSSYEDKAFIYRIKRPPLAFEVDPSTVGQYTGFKDKNNKEVYEGDVLRSDEYPFSRVECNELDNYYGTIDWNKKEASFNIMAIKNPESSDLNIFDGIRDPITQEVMYDFEVVGNIHDPEWQQKLKLTRNIV